MNQNQKIVVITGASSGMGYAAAQLFAQKGWQVFAGARRVELIPKNPNITALPLDVTESASNHAFIKTILQKTKRIDVLINNAGYGEFGAAEEVPLNAIRQQFETNFFGAIELTQLVLPSMRQRGSGRIINVSSIVGDIYLPLGAYYNASKAALQQWSNVLDLEICPFGLRSIVIQPGDTASAWGKIAFDHAQKNLKTSSAYQKLSEFVHAQKHRPGAKIATAEELAQTFYHAATASKPAFRYYQSFSDRFIVSFVRHCPRTFHFAFYQLISRLTR